MNKGIIAAIIISAVLTIMSAAPQIPTALGSLTKHNSSTATVCPLYITIIKSGFPLPWLQSSGNFCLGYTFGINYLYLAADLVIWFMIALLILYPVARILNKKQL